MAVLIARKCGGGGGVVEVLIARTILLSRQVGRLGELKRTRGAVDDGGRLDAKRVLLADKESILRGYDARERERGGKMR